MEVINLLPHFVDCLKRWPQAPSESQVQADFVAPVEKWLAPLLSDFWDFREATLGSAIADLDWPAYRAHALGLDPAHEERRVQTQLAAVEKSLKHKLSGEIILFGAFKLMDGYARFDEGTHRVYLGADESYHQGAYLDVLYSHELTHVGRESQPEVWNGWGYPLKVPHDDLGNQIRVVEHLMSEGFSCVVSELVNPINGREGCEGPWSYCYQTRESYAQIAAQAEQLDVRVHRELTAEMNGEEAHFRTLYDLTTYSAEFAPFAHYAWAFHWVRDLVYRHPSAKGEIDASLWVGKCSKDLVDDAKKFRFAGRLQ